MAVVPSRCSSVVVVEDLCNAIQNGDIEQVKQMVSSLSVEQLNSKNSKGLTALHVAAKLGNETVAELLLHVSGIDANVQDERGWTPLHVASSFGNARVLSLLLSFGCDTAITSSINTTAFTEARGASQLAWKIHKEGGNRALRQNNYPVFSERSLSRTNSAERLAKRRVTKGVSGSKLPKSLVKPSSVKSPRSPKIQVDIKDLSVKLEKLYQQAVQQTSNIMQGQGDEAKLVDAHLQALEAISILTKLSSNILSASPQTNMSTKYSYLTYFLPPQKEDLPPVIDEEKPIQFVIEPQTRTFNYGSYKLNVIPDVYTRDFFEIDHLKFGRYNPEKKEKFIIVVSTNSVYDLHQGLIISKKGYQEFVIPVKKGDVPIDKTVRRVTRFIHNKYKDDQIVLLDDPENQLPKEIQKIEINSPQVKFELKIGIIYAKQGQVNPHDMFRNATTPAFQTFLNDMEIDCKQNTEKWNDILVYWYISPFLNPDQHRRDVGNATCIIFYQEEGKPFDASQVQELGMVPQIFIVIQPGFKDMGYRVGFFRSGNLQPFDPPVPANHIFLPQTLKDFVLTKVYNGNIMFYYSNPMNRGFMMKRESDISSIVDKSITL